MKCLKPYVEGAEEYGCNRCLPCLSLRRRVWATRLMLESYQHEASCFITLTYSEDECPRNGCVSMQDAQLFVKRLRVLLSPIRVRYFLVGEYGDVSLRPHYHVALFGFNPLDHQVMSDCLCMVCKSWSKGFVSIGTLTPASANYVVSYVVKDMSRGAVITLPILGKPGCFATLLPEFAIMSRRPGIGAHAAPVIAAALMTRGGSQHMLEMGDVSTVVRSEQKLRPLGRYLRSKIRESCGMDDLVVKGIGEDRRRRLEIERCVARGAVGSTQEYLRVVEEQRVAGGRRALARHRINLSRKAVASEKV